MNELFMRIALFLVFCALAAAPRLASAATTNPASLAFGGQSMGTTSPALALTFTNNGATTISVSSVTVSSTQFAQTNNCTTLAAGASCIVNVTFTPAAAAGALNTTAAVTGTLTVISNATSSPNTVALSGTAEKSLITHYYRSILRRTPDASGKSFWESEAVRMQSIGVNVNETWYSMAGFFFTSAEYLAFNRDNNGFVTDLYNTFFNRPPDIGGLDYWTGQLDSGMPREVVLVSLMFTTEFVNSMQAIFGNTAARTEVDTLMDFYRGLLARLPDNSGFNFWVARFRNAQCAGTGAVTAQAESISSQFALGSSTPRELATTRNTWATSTTPSSGEAGIQPACSSGSTRSPAAR
ncbi:MAG: DUF4214 domain-containing protein [Betaproteobacteria bacterium]|nr:DUF4214 domain-containing protein [Betaproteobacteria bacterium]